MTAITTGDIINICLFWRFNSIYANIYYIHFVKILGVKGVNLILLKKRIITCFLSIIIRVTLTPALESRFVVSLVGRQCSEKSFFLRLLNTQISDIKGQSYVTVPSEKSIKRISTFPLFCSCQRNAVVDERQYRLWCDINYTLEWIQLQCNLVCIKKHERNVTPRTDHEINTYNEPAAYKCDNAIECCKIPPSLATETVESP